MRYIVINKRSGWGMGFMVSAKHKVIENSYIFFEVSIALESTGLRFSQIVSNLLSLSNKTHTIRTSDNSSIRIDLFLENWRFIDV
jgi:hypothetical protein